MTTFPLILLLFFHAMAFGAGHPTYKKKPNKAPVVSDKPLKAYEDCLFAIAKDEIDDFTDPKAVFHYQFQEERGGVRGIAIVAREGKVAFFAPVPEKKIYQIPDPAFADEQKPADQQKPLYVCYRAMGDAATDANAKKMDWTIFLSSTPVFNDDSCALGAPLSESNKKRHALYAGPSSLSIVTTVDDDLKRDYQQSLVNIIERHFAGRDLDERCKWGSQLNKCDGIKESFPVTIGSGGPKGLNSVYFKNFLKNKENSIESSCNGR